MLCEKCGKNNATTHIRTVVNGVVIDKNLCIHCAVSEGYGDINSSSLTQMLSSMFGDALTGAQVSHITRCDCCGSSFADIAKSGKCGCSQCYTTFYNELLPYLKRVHGSIKHIGKVPNRAPLAAKEDEDTVEFLRSKLNQLVREEKYEQAAVIRDKIKRLEGEAQ